MFVLVPPLLMAAFLHISREGTECLVLSSLCLILEMMNVVLEDPLSQTTSFRNSALSIYKRSSHLSLLTVCPATPYLFYVTRL